MIRTALSKETTVQQVAADIQLQFSAHETRYLLFFASPKFDPQELASALQQTFPKATQFGCTTAGEIGKGELTNGCVVAMSWESTDLEFCSAELIPTLQPHCSLEPAFKVFETQTGSKMNTLDSQRYVGMVLVDGMQMAEENLIAEIAERTNVIFIGGSAGDDLAFQKTHVFLNGKAHSNAAILILIKPSYGFDFIKTQSFEVFSEKKLIATKVDASRRTVQEFNHQPAAVAYAAGLGVTVEQLQSELQAHPLGLIIAGEPFVRSPQRIDDHEISFYCAIDEGTELQILNSTDIVGDTKTALEEKILETHGRIAGIVNFHCILRTIELNAKNKSKEYASLFEKWPCIGFSTYGEQFHFHVNQTSTMLVFFSRR